MPEPSNKTICLQGDAGCGKSKMAGETAYRQPVHFVDIDRKIRSAEWAQPLIANGKLTVWELAEAVDDSNLKARLDSLIKKDKPNTQPKGWSTFAEYFYKLPTTPEGKAAGTWVFDSLTILNEHAKTHIMYVAGRSKFTFDQWSALKSIWIDTISVIRDVAIENKKDVVFIVHERAKDTIGERTTGMVVETVATPEGVNQVKTPQGKLDVEMWASIDGAFGGLIGMQTDEYYFLYVDSSDKDKPVWKCRVKPDGRRALRTSFNLDKAVYNPDFREIWGVKK